jgi:hypothetical protein
MNFKNIILIISSNILKIKEFQVNKKNKKPLPLKERIIQLLEKGNRSTIERMILLELKHLPLKESTLFCYCSCGFPTSFQIEEVNHKNESDYRYVFLYDILNYESDIDKFTSSTSCPKCNRLLEES